MADGGADAAKIREKLILANLKLVPYTILKYAKSSVIPVSDMIQEGNIALMKAVDTNDYKKGFTFSTYAVNVIRFALLNKIANETGLVRIPTDIIHEVKKVNKAEDDYIEKYAKKPSDFMLAKLIRRDPYWVKAVKRVLLDSFDIDAPIYTKREFQNKYVATNNFDATGDDKYTFAESLIAHGYGDTVSKIYDLDMMYALKKLLNQLTPREKLVFTTRIGLDNQGEVTQTELANKLGISKARVSQLELKAIKKLRSHENLETVREFLG